METKLILGGIFSLVFFLTFKVIEKLKPKYDSWVKILFALTISIGITGTLLSIFVLYLFGSNLF